MIFTHQRKFKKQVINNVLDKPILHKKGKRWIVLSISALMLGGIGLVGTHTASASQVKTDTNNQPTQTANQKPVSATPQNIGSQATNLHAQLMATNAKYTIAHQAPSSASNSNEPSSNSAQSTSSNFASSSANSNNKVSSGSVSNNQASSSSASSVAPSSIKSNVNVAPSFKSNQVSSVASSSASQTKVNSVSSSAFHLNSSSTNSLGSSFAKPVSNQTKPTVPNFTNSTKVSSANVATPKANLKAVPNKTNNLSITRQNNLGATANTYNGMNYKYNNANHTLEFTSGSFNWTRKTTYYSDDNQSDKQAIIPFIGHYEYLNSDGSDSDGDNAPNNLYSSQIKDIIFDKGINNLPTLNSFKQDLGSDVANDKISGLANTTPTITYHNKQSNNDWIKTDKGYLSDNSVSDWRNGASDYDGFTYKFSPSTKAMEFTGGTAQSDLSNFLSIMPISASNVKSMKFDDSINTTHVKSMNNMFSYSNSDDNIQSLVLGNSFDTSHVKDMSYMFNNTKLTSINLPDSFNTSNVTDMSGMFQTNPYLTKIKFPKSFNVSNVKNMYLMFFSDKSLSSFAFPNNFNPYNVTNMGGMFMSDTKLKSIDFPNNFNTTHLTDISSMFLGDSDLSSINLPNTFDTRNVTNMNTMFSDDSDLTSLVLPNKFDTNKVKDMDGMFDGDALQALTVNSPDTKFNKSSGLINMYKETGGQNSDGRPYTLGTPNNFNKGNLGTFISFETLPSNKHNSKPTNKSTNEYSYSDIYGSTDEKVVPGDTKSDSIPPKNDSDSDSDWAFVNSDGIISSHPKFDKNGKIMIAPIYKGLVYRNNTKDNTTEFVSGTASNDFSDFHSDSDFNSDTNIIFDKNIDMSKVSDLSQLFYQFNNLQNIEGMSDWNVNNVKSVWRMFRSDMNLNPNVLNELKSWRFNHKPNSTAMVYGTSLNNGNYIGTIPDGTDGKYMFGFPLHGNQHKPTPKPQPNELVYSDIYHNIDKFKEPSKLIVKNKNGVSDRNSDIISSYSYVDANGMISKTPVKDKNGHIMVAPIYAGVVYKYDKANDTVEFTNGTVTPSDVSRIHGNDVPSDGKNDQASDGQTIGHGTGEISNSTNSVIPFSTDRSDTSVCIRHIKFDDDVNFSKVTNMTSMFDGDETVESIDFGKGFNTSKVRTMHPVFDSDSDLNELIITSPNTKFNASSYIEQPSFNSVQWYQLYPSGYTSANSTNLGDNKSHVGTWVTYRKLPKSKPLPTPTTMGYSDIYGSFDGFTAPNSINNITTTHDDKHLKGWDYVDKNGNITNTPVLAPSGKYLVAPSDDGLTYKYNKNNGSLEYVSGKLIYSYPTYYGASSNGNVTKPLTTNTPVHQDVKSIKFDDNVDTNNISDMSYLFQGIPNVNSIDFGDNFNTSNVSNMSQMFHNDNNLRYITFSNNFDTRKAVQNSDNDDVFNGTLYQITVKSPNTKFSKISDEGGGSSDVDPEFDDNVQSHGSDFVLSIKGSNPSQYPSYMGMTAFKLVNGKPTNIYANFGDGKSHVGTWTVFRPNSSDTIEYINADNNQVVSSAKFKGIAYNADTSLSNYINSDNVSQDPNGNFYDADNKLPNLDTTKYIIPVRADNSQVFNNNSFTKWNFNNNVIKVYVEPIADEYSTNTFNYIYNNKVVGSYTFKGIKGSMMSDMDIGKFLTGATFKNLPSLYTVSSDTINDLMNQYATGNTQLYFNGATENIPVTLAPQPTTETFDYDYNGKTIGQNQSHHVYTGARMDRNSIGNKRVRANYHLVHKDNWITVTKNGVAHIQVEPNNYTDTVDYVYKNQTKGTQQINGAFNTTINLTGKNAKLPKGYHLAKNTEIKITKNGTDKVDVVPNVIPNPTVHDIAHLHLVYKESNGKVDSTSDKTLNFTGRQGTNENIFALLYGKNGYRLNLESWNFKLEPNANLTHTFTYVGTEANNLKIRYVDVDPQSAMYHQVVGNQNLDNLGTVNSTVYLGAKGANDTGNVKDVLEAPVGYYLADKINPIKLHLSSRPMMLTLFMGSPTMPIRHIAKPKSITKPKKPTTAPSFIPSKPITKPIVINHFKSASLPVVPSDITKALSKTKQTNHQPLLSNKVIGLDNLAPKHSIKLGKTKITKLVANRKYLKALNTLFTPSERKHLKVNGIYSIRQGKHMVIKYSIRFNHHHYMVKATKWLPSLRKYRGKHIKLIQNVVEHNGFGHAYEGMLSKGKVVTIKRIKALKHSKFTRIELSNHKWITANVNYVELVK